MVGIGHVGAGRCEKGNFLALASFAWNNKERNVILARCTFVTFPGANMQCVGAAPQVRRNAQRDGWLPSGVVKIVVVKMDRAIMFGLGGPAMFRPVPIVAFHGARR